MVCVVSGRTEDWQSNASVSALAEQLEKLRIHLVQLEAKETNFSERGPRPAPRGFTCFFCDEPGHRKFECPKYQERRNLRPGAVETPASGSNSIPLGAGKGPERQ
ncbi:hypothetical protein G6F56_014181 [Rhizopus delemar]|nr:hypothetical protein G6F56_014181 [Rhizopus delemar]